MRSLVAFEQLSLFIFLTVVFDSNCSAMTSHYRSRLALGYGIGVRKLPVEMAGWCSWSAC